MPTLSVHLVTWNGARYLPHLLSSLRAQMFRDWSLLAIDNGSTDGTADTLEREFRDFPVPARCIRNTENRGFAGGHNQALRVCGVRRTESGEPAFVQLVNQDMVLAPDYLARVLAFMGTTPQCAAAQGILLRWDWTDPTHPIRTDIVDTMGLRVLRNRRVVEWKTGERMPAPAPGASSSPFEVFGVSGALPMYRAAALRDVALQRSVVEVFDEDFFSYKEDVDLAFRLRSAGWSAYVVPDARAWHDRTAAGPRALSDYAALGHRTSKSAFVSLHSYRNHLLLLLANEHRATFARDWLRIVWYEGKKLLYLCCFERRTLRALRDVWCLRHRTRAKRRAIMAQRRVPPAALQQWYA